MRPKLGSLLMVAAMIGAENDNNTIENYKPQRQSEPEHKRKLCKSCDKFHKSSGYCGVKNFITPKSKACDLWTKRKKK